MMKNQSSERVLNDDELMIGTLQVMNVINFECLSNSFEYKLQTNKGDKIPEYSEVREVAGSAT